MPQSRVSIRKHKAKRRCHRIRDVTFNIQVQPTNLSYRASKRGALESPLIIGRLHILSSRYQWDTELGPCTTTTTTTPRSLKLTDISAVGSRLTGITMVRAIVAMIGSANGKRMTYQIVHQQR